LLQLALKTKYCSNDSAISLRQLFWSDLVFNANCSNDSAISLRQLFWRIWFLTPTAAMIQLFRCVSCFGGFGF
jgi:hypothetical protein